MTLIKIVGKFKIPTAYDVFPKYTGPVAKRLNMQKRFWGENSTL